VSGTAAAKSPARAVCAEHSMQPLLSYYGLLLTIRPTGPQCIVCPCSKYNHNASWNVENRVSRHITGHFGDDFYRQQPAVSKH